jgi:hypothetical protein
VADRRGPRRPERRITIAIQVALALAVLGVGIAMFFGQGGDPDESTSLQIQQTDEPATRVVTVPEDGETFPDRLDLRVGDVLEIRNPTTVGEDIGPLYAPAGSTRRWKMLGAGTYSGSCSLHARGFVLDVTAPTTD